MKLELAIVLECGPEGCQVKYLDGGETGPVTYSAAVRDRIRIRRGQLVAVDRSTQLPQIVWRLMHGKVHAADRGTFTVSRFDSGREHTHDEAIVLRDVRPVPDLEVPVAVGDIVFYEHGAGADAGQLYDVAVDGLPVHKDRLAAHLYPRILDTYSQQGQ